MLIAEPQRFHNLHLQAGEPAMSRLYFTIRIPLIQTVSPLFEDYVMPQRVHYEEVLAGKSLPLTGLVPRSTELGANQGGEFALLSAPVAQVKACQVNQTRLLAYAHLTDTHNYQVAAFMQNLQAEGLNPRVGELEDRVYDPEVRRRGKKRGSDAAFLC